MLFNCLGTLWIISFRLILVDSILTSHFPNVFKLGIEGNSKQQQDFILIQSTLI